MERALIIREPWISMILSGDKCWEMRSTKTKVRGKIGLIRQGTGLIVGTANLVLSLPPQTSEELRQTFRFHRVPYGDGGYHKWTCPWVLENVITFDEPITYVHKKGAVIWVKNPLG